MIFPMTLSGAKQSAVGAVRLYGPPSRMAAAKAIAPFRRRMALKAAALIAVAAYAVFLALPASTPAALTPADTTFGWMARV
jgi:hypothetical protein